MAVNDNCFPEMITSQPYARSPRIQNLGSRIQTSGSSQKIRDLSTRLQVPDRALGASSPPTLGLSQGYLHPPPSTSNLLDFGSFPLSAGLPSSSSSRLRRHPLRPRAAQDHHASLPPEITWRRAPHLHQQPRSLTALSWLSANNRLLISLLPSFPFSPPLLYCTLVLQPPYQSFFDRAVAHCIHSGVSTDPFHSFQPFSISPGRLRFQSRIPLTFPSIRDRTLSAHTYQYPYSSPKHDSLHHSPAFAACEHCLCRSPL